MAKVIYADKAIQTGAYDATKFNSQDANELKLSLNSLYDSVGSYKSFVGLMTFTSVFGMTKISGNLGAFTVTNPAVGRVRVTSTASELVAAKTVIFLGSGRRQFFLEVDYSFLPSWFDINIYDQSNTQISTPSINMAIEIRVYD